MRLVSASASRPTSAARLCAMVVATLALLLVLAGPAASPVVAQGDPVVVYSARIEALIKPMFDAFTRQTGIPVKTFSASEAELFERLKAEGAGTPADVLMTVDVGNLWLPSRRGCFSPSNPR